MKTVLITGASSGIGYACGKLFLSLGYKVVFHYNTTVIDVTSFGEDAISYKADICDFKQVEQMFLFVKEKFGGVDILINNAGVQHISMLCDTNAEDWQKVIDTDLTGVYNTTKCALDYMMWNGGKIVNISSIWGQCGGACESAYSAAKAGVIGLTKALAKEYSNINVNCICPGVIEGKMNNRLSQEEKEQLVEQIPLKRFGKPEEVAYLTEFLCSSKADYITGQVFAVNGGMYM